MISLATSPLQQQGLQSLWRSFALPFASCNHLHPLPIVSSCAQEFQQRGLRLQVLPHCARGFDHAHLAIQRKLSCDSAKQASSIEQSGLPLANTTTSRVRAKWATLYLPSGPSTAAHWGGPASMYHPTSAAAPHLALGECGQWTQHLSRKAAQPARDGVQVLHLQPNKAAILQIQ